jgi:hypothetical protein
MKLASQVLHHLGNCKIDEKLQVISEYTCIYKQTDYRSFDMQIIFVQEMIFFSFLKSYRYVVHVLKFANHIEILNV